MKRKLAACSILVVLLLPLAGCLTNPHGDVPEELVLRVRTFEDVVRWGALQKIYLFQKYPEGAVPQIAEGLDNVRVTGYELAEPLHRLDPLRWRQTAVIDYVLTDRQVVRQLIDPQIWESEDEGQSWYRTTPVPEFR